MVGFSGEEPGAIEVLGIPGVPPVFDGGLGQARVDHGQQQRDTGGNERFRERWGDDVHTVSESVSVTDVLCRTRLTLSMSFSDTF